MTAGTLAAACLLALAGQTPEIASVAPLPLALGGTADVDGAGFAPNETTVSVGGVAQAVVFAQAEKVRFDVSLATPLGTHTLVVTTPTGQAEVEVEVVPAAPTLLGVLEPPVVLGSVATLSGEDLEAVEAVTLGGVDCAITAQSVTLLAFEAPLDVSLVGTQAVVVTSPWGTDSLDVDVAPPTPVVDLLSPNPVRQGDLLTLGGTLVPWLLDVTIGGVEARVLEVGSGSLVVEVPDELAPGPTAVVVTSGAVASEPAGPLVVEAADPLRPTVDAVLPSVVAEGGAVWVTGSHLDDLSWWSEGVDVTDCDAKACRVALPGLPVGPGLFALGSDAGTSVAAVQIEAVDGELVVPTLSDTSPQPATRGELLTVTGEGLHEVTVAVLGGVQQPLEFVGTDELRLLVAPATSLGAERLFVAGATASNALTLVVLDPLPTGPEPGPEPDVPSTTPDTWNEQSTDAGPEPDPEDIGEPDDASDPPPVESTPPPGGGGCGAAVPTPFALLGWLALVAVRGRRRR